jgi:signal transduction histidine kinase
MKPSPAKFIQRARRSIWTLPVAALAALVLFGINETAYDSSTRALTSLGDRAVARTQIQQLWRALVDAETGQRGYLLTARPEYLVPYHRALVEVQSALAWLSTHYRGDPAASPLLDEIRERSADKISELGTTLALHASGRHEAWHELMMTDIGREKMDRIRTTSQQLLTLETDRVATERKAVFATLSAGRIGIGVMTGFSMLALFLFLRQTLDFDAAQRQHARAIGDERDLLEAEVARRTADLTDLARHLETAREDERGRLARELHDELGALMTAARLDVARLKRATSGLSDDIATRLVHLNDTIQRGIELKRRIIEDLRPSSLSNLGLHEALRILTREFAERADMQIQARLEPVQLSESAQITAYRLVQEALTNVAKHAGATQLEVWLLHDEPSGSDVATGAPLADSDAPQGQARVGVRDNGRGFDPTVRHGSTHGLMGMRYRVEAECGRMQIDAAPGRGTVIQAWLPTVGVASQDVG